MDRTLRHRNPKRPASSIVAERRASDNRLSKKEAVAGDRAMPVRRDGQDGEPDAQAKDGQPRGLQPERVGILGSAAGRRRIVADDLLAIIRPRGREESHWRG